MPEMYKDESRSFLLKGTFTKNSEQLIRIGYQTEFNMIHLR
jgi:hypothetical protein